MLVCILSICSLQTIVYSLFHDGLIATFDGVAFFVFLKIYYFFLTFISKLFCYTMYDSVTISEHFLDL